MCHTTEKKEKRFQILKVCIWALKIFYCYSDILHSTLLIFILKKKVGTKDFACVCVCIVFFILSTGNVSFSAKTTLI